MDDEGKDTGQVEIEYEEYEAMLSVSDICSQFSQGKLEFYLVLISYLISLLAKLFTFHVVFRNWQFTLVTTRQANSPSKEMLHIYTR